MHLGYGVFVVIHTCSLYSIYLMAYGAFMLIAVSVLGSA